MKDFLVNEQYYVSSFANYRLWHKPAIRVIGGSTIRACPVDFSHRNIGCVHCGKNGEAINVPRSKFVEPVQNIQFPAKHPEGQSRCPVRLGRTCHRAKSLWFPLNDSKKEAAAEQWGEHPISPTYGAAYGLRPGNPMDKATTLGPLSTEATPGPTSGSNQRC
jgi:hypothetical protein